MNDGYGVSFSVELRKSPKVCHVILIMECALLRDTVRAWRIDPGQAWVFEQNPQLMAAFVVEKMRGILK